MRQSLRFFRSAAVIGFLAASLGQAKAFTVQPEQRDARAWMEAVQSAARHQSYHGTFVYQQGDRVRTSRITHLADGRNEYEKLEILDGKPREHVRTNDEIVTYIPETRTLIAEKRSSQEVFPALVASGGADIESYYAIRKAETGRVAGFDCQAIVLEPRDRMRYGYKLWAEKGSGLLLRLQTLNQDGEVIEQVAFTQLKLGGIDRQQVRPSHTSTAGWRMEQAVTASASASGWEVRDLPPGFRKIREARRRLGDPAAGIGAGSARDMIQLVYSDGLAAVSVFIEPGSQSRTEGSLRQGAMHVIGKRQGDFWLTIVGEIPFPAIRRIADSIEFKSR